MAQQLNIVICDDDDDRAEDWAVRVRDQVPHANVQSLGAVSFAGAVRDLKQRMSAAKAGEPSPDDDSAVVIDRADVLVLDSDLTPDRDAHIGDDPDDLVGTHLASELGAEVAYLARAYSSAGAIVVVNEGAKQSTFDLTLVKRSDGIADVYVTDDELDNPGLWDPSKASGYRPWSWPALASLPANIEAAIARCKLTDLVTEAVGLGDFSAELLIGQIERLGQEDAAAVVAMTFEDVAQSAGFGLGLRPKEQPPDSHRLRVAVCGLRRWLDRVVVPEQNILIDLPHLLQRNPWLVVPDRTDISAWDTLVAGWAPADPPVAPTAFNHLASHLLGRAVWNARDVPARPAGQRIEPTDPVFCEDTSTFRPLEASSGFLSDLQGSHARRFISRVPDVTYSPAARLMR